MMEGSEDPFLVDPLDIENISVTSLLDLQPEVGSILDKDIPDSIQTKVIHITGFGPVMCIQNLPEDLQKLSYSGIQPGKTLGHLALSHGMIQNLCNNLRDSLIVLQKENDLLQKKVTIQEKIIGRLSTQP
jgi:hypothetical protein